MDKSSVEVQGGTGPYLYQLGQEEQTDSLFKDLPVGTYRLNVTDVDGCVDSVEVVIDTSEAATAEISLTSTHCGLANGMVIFESLSGVAPFAFALNDKVSEVSTFQDVEAGTYIVKMADADQCSWSDTITIEPSNAIYLESEIVPTSCGLDNGSIRFLAEGGTGQLSYSLLDTAFEKDRLFFENLAAGNYLMRVRDEEDCVLSEQVEVLPSTNPDLMFEVLHTRCGLENGQLQLKSDAGEGPFEFHINDDILLTPEAARFNCRHIRTKGHRPLWMQRFYDGCDRNIDCPSIDR